MLLEEFADLDEAWPKGEAPLEPLEVGRHHEAVLKRIAEVESRFVDTKAHTPASAALQLRWPLATIGDRLRPRAYERLLTSALAVIEAACAAT